VQKAWQNGAPLEEILRYGGETPERGQFRMGFFLEFCNWGAGPCSDLRKTCKNLQLDTCSRNLGFRLLLPYSC